MLASPWSPLVQHPGCLDLGSSNLASLIIDDKAGQFACGRQLKRGQGKIDGVLRDPDLERAVNGPGISRGNVPGQDKRDVWRHVALVAAVFSTCHRTLSSSVTAT